MSTGFTWPWEQAAMRGDELPDGLSLPDQMAYTALRNLYYAYHTKYLDRAAAAAEKKRVRRSYEQAVSQMEFKDKLACHRAKILRNTESAKAACRRDPTPENVLRLCNVLDGLAQTNSDESER